MLRADAEEGKADDGRRAGGRLFSPPTPSLSSLPSFSAALRAIFLPRLRSNERTNERTKCRSSLSLLSLFRTAAGGWRPLSSIPTALRRRRQRRSAAFSLSLSLPSLAPPSSSLSILYRGRKCCRCGVGKQALSSLSSFAILCAFLPYIRERRLDGTERRRQERKKSPSSLALLRNASLCLRVTSPPPIAWSSGRTVVRSVGGMGGHGEGE